MQLVSLWPPPPASARCSRQLLWLAWCFAIIYSAFLLLSTVFLLRNSSQADALFHFIFTCRLWHCAGRHLFGLRAVSSFLAVASPVALLAGLDSPGTARSPLFAVAPGAQAASATATLALPLSPFTVLTQHHHVQQHCHHSSGSSALSSPVQHDQQDEATCSSPFITSRLG